MSLAAFAVRNRSFMIVVFGALLATGAFSLFTIPRTEDPTFPIATYSTLAVYPGANATDLEQLVVDPIEARLRELDDLEEVRSSIEDGVAVVIAEFDPAIDAERKYNEVLRELNALRPELPADLARFETVQFNAANVNIVQLALVSPAASYQSLTDQAERLTRQLARVSGVAESERWASPEREVRVAIDLARLAALGLPLHQVLQVIQSESMNIPGGRVDAGRRSFNVKTSGHYATLAEVRETIVGGTAGATVRLQDVADVTWDYAEQTHIGRFNGQRAVFVTANMKEGRNIMAVRDHIWRVVDDFERELPAGIRLERGFDQSRNVSARLRRLGEDFLIAILLVLITLLPLGFRAAGVVMVAIPLSLAIGLTLLKAAGHSLNQLSIVGFVIALGLLVDDSIVVVENITRYLRQGMHRVAAAVAGTRQITVAVLGTTATLVFAFLPLLVLPGAPGKFIRGMPMAVVFTILASLVISLTIIPFLAALVLREETSEHGNIFLRALNRLIDLTYARWMHRALAWPRLTLVAAAVLFMGTLALVPVVGFSLFPKAGTPQFLVSVETPAGWAMAQTDSAARLVESILQRRPEVRSVFTNVGRGNPRIYYNITPGSERTNVAELFVTLRRYDRDTPAMFDSLRRQFDAYPNARILVKEFENGPPIVAPIELRLLGSNLDTLRHLASRLESVLLETPGTRDVTNPLRLSQTDLRLMIDRPRAGLLGIQTVEIDRTVRLAIAGLTAGTLRDSDGEEYDITVRLPRTGRQTLDAFDHVYVSSVRGTHVPLRQVARPAFEASPPLIQHIDGERATSVTAFVRTGYNTSRVTADVLERVGQLDLPGGYRVEAGGELASREQSFGGIGTAILVATFGILAILVLEFRTFRGMLIVASVIPLGLVGGILGLVLSGYTLSFTAMIGFVALIGIEIKNSILLVDFTSRLREQGATLDDAIEQAGRVRFVPIVLTTLTAIGGLLPLALQGSSLYSPLAIVIIGGLISSTLLSRLVTPVAYKLLPPALERDDVPVVSGTDPALA
jgi:multidrug efflux pump subunit AcrB